MLEKIVDLGISKREAEELIKVSSDITLDYLKLKKNYPIQYLIGYVDFYGNKILVNEKVLIPRFETETLTELVIEKIKENNFKFCLDLCTGSGCIAIAIAKNSLVKVDASDISIDALKVAEKNSIINDVKINFIKSDLFENIKRTYDVIVTNPPYISKKEVLSNLVLKEPKTALFSEEEGLFHIKKIIIESEKFLNKKSILAIEIGSCHEKSLTEFLKSLNKADFKFYKDLTKRTRYLFIFNNC